MATVPVAPGRFSTTIDCPSASDTIGASNRDRISMEPPAPNGISTRIGLVGHGSAARAEEPATAAATTPPVADSNSLRVNRLGIFALPGVRASMADEYSK